MDQQDAINLIKGGVTVSQTSQTWVDLGCGKGTFTEALATLLPDHSVVYAIDKNRSDLNNITDAIRSINIEKVELDFLKEGLPSNNVDGVLMANSLHYVREKIPFLKKVIAYLSNKGCLVIVEYEARFSNPWVPYPISKIELGNILMEVGFNDIQDLGNMNSRYGHIIYSVGCSL